MFSRAAKSVARSLGQRCYHPGEEAFKMVGGADGMGRSFSRMLRQGSKLDAVVLYDASAAKKRFYTNSIQIRQFSDGEGFTSLNSRLKPMSERLRTLDTKKSSASTEKTNEKQAEKLIEALQELPIAEGSIAQRHIKLMSQGDSIHADGVLGELEADTLQTWRHNTKHLSDRTVPRAKACSPITETPKKPFSLVVTLNTKTNKNETLTSAPKQPRNEPSVIFLLNLSKKQPRKKVEEPRIEESLRFDLMPKRTMRKSKNWTIPAALSERKPTLLHEFDIPKRKPINGLFSTVFGTSSPDYQASACNRSTVNDGKCVTSDTAKAPRPREELLSLQKKYSDKSVNVSKSILGLVDKAAKEAVTFSHLPNIPERSLNGLTTKGESIDFNTATLFSDASLLRKDPRAKNSLASLRSYNLESLFREEPPPFKRICPAPSYPVTKKCGVKNRITNFIRRKQWARSKGKSGSKKNYFEERKKSITDSLKRPNRGESEAKEAKQENSCKGWSGKDVFKKPSVVCATIIQRIKIRTKPKAKTKETLAQKESRQPSSSSCKDYIDMETAERADPCNKYRDEKIYGPNCKKKKDCSSVSKMKPSNKNDPCKETKKDDPCKKKESKKDDPCQKVDLCKRAALVPAEGAFAISKPCPPTMKICHTIEKSTPECTSLTKYHNLPPLPPKQKMKTSCASGKKDDSSKTESSKKEPSKNELPKVEPAKIVPPTEEKSPCPPVIRAPECPPKDKSARTGSNFPNLCDHVITITPKDIRFYERRLSRRMQNEFSITMNRLSKFVSNRRLPDRKVDLCPIKLTSLDIYKLLYEKSK